MNKNTYVDARREFDKQVFGNSSKWEFCFITPKEYLEMQGKDTQFTLKELEEMAKRADKGFLCDCENDVIWQHANSDMCFSCTTGETDRSEDLELTMDAKKQPHHKNE